MDRDQNHDAAIQEYISLRQELYVIIQSRYWILTANIAFIATLAGIAFMIKQPNLNLWLPAVFTSILLPSIIMNWCLTEHFTRLAAYLYVRFEEEERLGLLFEKALEEFKEIYKERHGKYKAYTKPLYYTYSLLILIAAFIAAIINIDLFLPVSVRSISYLGIIIVISIILYIFNKKSKSVRDDEEKFRGIWREALKKLQNAKAHTDKKMKEKVFVFIDRDGVINFNRDDHVKSLDEFQFLPRAIESLVTLSKRDLGIVLISNQPIIEEEKATRKTVDRINRSLVDAVESAGGKIDKVYYCPHSEKNTKCNCRKPKPGMLLQASGDLGINLRHSYLIGDQITDIEAGKSVGSYSILVRTGLGDKWLARKHEWNVQPDDIVMDIKEATNLILTKVDT